MPSDGYNDGTDYKHTPHSNRHDLMCQRLSLTLTTKIDEDLRLRANKTLYL